ncbi:MAG: membrane protein insertion efficiency factor YidD [Cyanobacteria bacterium P01_F01_bin.86]
MPLRLSTPLELAIRGYKVGISPLLPASCRYYPTCSQYALESLQKFGLFGGSYLAACRICRCHPWNPGGFDPVPDTWAEAVGKTNKTDSNRPSKPAENSDQP